MGRIPILKETTISEWQKANDNYFFSNFTPESPVRMNIGETYIVVFDGTEYACECEWSLFGYLKLGIEDIDGVLTTGFPFGVLAKSMYDVQILVTDGNAHTFAIYQDISNVSRITILPETTLTEMEPFGDFYSAECKFMGLEAGKKYIVEWDGTRYECVCITHPDYESASIIGNFSFYPEVQVEGNGEPFAVMDYKEENFAYIDTLTPAPHTIAIYEEIADGGSEGPIGFIEFMSGPNFPYLPKNLFGWKLAQMQAGSTDEPNVVRIDILQETTLTEMSEVSPGAYRVLFKNQHIGLADGEKYIVEWDGTRYECVSVTIPSSTPIYGLGNFSWDEEFGFDGDDVPFCVMDYPVNNRMAFTAIGAPAPHTIAIYQEIEVV